MSEVKDRPPQQHSFVPGTGTARDSNEPACAVCFNEESFIYHQQLPPNQCADCQAGGYFHMGKGNVNLIYLCPRHAAVDELVEALQRIARSPDHLGAAFVNDFAVKIATAALAVIERQGL